MPVATDSTPTVGKTRHTTQPKHVKSVCFSFFLPSSGIKKKNLSLLPILCFHPRFAGGPAFSPSTERGPGPTVTTHSDYAIAHNRQSTIQCAHNIQKTDQKNWVLAGWKDWTGLGWVRFAADHAHTHAHDEVHCHSNSGKPLRTE